MRKIVLDQCALIALQGGPNQASMQAICANNDNLIYLQDANFREALQSGAANYERIVRSVAPYKDRVRIAPSHTEILQYEVQRLRPATKHWVHRHNRAEDGSELIDMTLSGEVTAQSVLDDPRWANVFSGEVSQNRAIITQHYESLSEAVDDSDRRSGRPRRERIRYRFAQHDAINDDVLSMTIKLALGSIRADTRRWLGTLRPYHALVSAQSYHLMHALTRWIRACQQIQLGNMRNWLLADSDNIVNEYYDTLNVSYAPLFDEFITHDAQSIQTHAYLVRALQIYGSRREQYVGHAMTLAD